MDIHHLRTEIDGHHSYNIVALLDGQFVDTLKAYQLENACPHLGDIYVHADYHQRKVTWNMVCKALELLKYGLCSKFGTKVAFGP